MSDPPNDESRLRATEAQMRRALGLQVPSSPRPDLVPSPSSTNGSPRPPRRFVRDGEVAVTIVHRDHRHDEASGTNQLDAARKALREQIAAREVAERSLDEAQATIRDLQTNLAHERLARDEALQRAESERQGIEQSLAMAQAELAAERLARRCADQALADALDDRQKAEERQLRALRVQAAQKPSRVNRTGKVATAATKAVRKPGAVRKSGTAGAMQKNTTAARSQQPRRRGRPPKARPSGAKLK